MKFAQHRAHTTHVSAPAHFFAPAIHLTSAGVPPQIQRTEDEETEPPRADSHASSGEREIEVVAMHDIEEGTTEVSTESSAEREINEEWAEVVETETSADESQTYAGMRYRPHGGPLSFTGGLLSTHDRSGSNAYPFVRITVGGERHIFTWLHAEGEANLTLDGRHRTPALEAEGRFLFLPRATVAPFLAGDVNTEEERARLRTGVQLNLPHDIQIRASVMAQVGFNGNVGLGGSAGIVIPLGR